MTTYSSLDNAPFISFDGVDGAGKSTQIELLTKHLAALGRAPHVFRDPGGTQLGDAVREILLHKKEIPLGLTTEMLLYMASRAQLVEELIRPRLNAGETVISDRFLLANIVYQGHAGGLETETIRRVGQIATGGLKPRITIVLDLQPELAMARVGNNQDRLESRGLGYMTKVRAGFLAEADSDSSIKVVDASRTIDEIHQHVVQLVEEAFAAEQ